MRLQKTASFVLYESLLEMSCPISGSYDPSRRGLVDQLFTRRKASGALLLLLANFGKRPEPLIAKISQRLWRR